MIQKKVKIIHKNGLHLRPGMMIVDIAGKFNCDITITKEDGTIADANSMMQVTMLAASSGEELTITAEGKDEQEAIDVLVELIESDFKNLSEIEK